MLSESKCSQVLERPMVTWACSLFLFLWWFKNVQMGTAEHLRVYPQLYRQTNTHCSQWQFCPSKRLGIVPSYPCLNVDLSRINTHVAVALICLQSREHPASLASPGTWPHLELSCRRVLRTLMAHPTCVLPQESSDRYLWGYSSLRHSAFGAQRYCPPLGDVLGQIDTSKVPVLTDKAEGSSSPNAEYFQPALSWSWRACLVFLRLNFYRGRNRLLI